MADAQAPTAPRGFSSRAFRFDVRGTHPRNKPPGTSISKTYYFNDKERHLGPGSHEVPLDLTAEDARRRVTKSPLDGWSLASSNPKHDHLVSAHRKALREFKDADATSRGPGFYDAHSFTDTCDLSKSTLVRSTSMHGRSAATPPMRLAAHTLTSSSMPSSPFHLGLATHSRPRSVSPAHAPYEYGFGRVSSRDDQREMYKSATFAGNMLQATVNPTAPGMYSKVVAPPSAGRTYQSAFASTTPRFERTATTHDYDNERLRPRHS